jgi:hypothetical protein
MPGPSQTLNARTGTRAQKTGILPWVLQCMSFRYVSRAATYIGKGLPILNLLFVQGEISAFVGPPLSINLRRVLKRQR